MNGEMDPELLDEDVRRMEQDENDDPEIVNDETSWMEQEEPPRLNRTIKHRRIKPILDDAQYKKLNRCYLLPEQGARDIEPGVCYYTRDTQTRRVQFKFLVLKRILAAPYIRAKLALEGAKWGTATRDSAGSQPHAKKITWGFYPQTPGHRKGNDYYSIRSKPTLEQPALAYDLKPLVKAMDACLAEYLPTYYPKALEHALHAEQRDDVAEDDWSRIPRSPLPGRPEPVSLVKGIDGPWRGQIYTLWGTVFSTLELNNQILFKAHEDRDNVKGDLICIAALGNWVGGRLIFPRYGYGADLGETDLLICDNANELHGNVGPLVGEKNKGRFSVVAFMHSSILDYANRAGLWAPSES
jgi:hypothetical protein